MRLCSVLYFTGFRIYHAPDVFQVAVGRKAAYARRIFLYSFMMILVCATALGKGFAGSGKVNDTARIIRNGDSIIVNTKAYSWRWSEKNDRFALFDHNGHRIVSGPLQPAVLVNSGRNTQAGSSRGKITGTQISGNRLSILYSSVNGGSSMKLSCRFDEEGWWLEPIDYTGEGGKDVVSVYYFSDIQNKQPVPALQSYWVVQPGISAAGSVGPVQAPSSRINLESWLGKGATMDYGRILQQWGLPTHFFCGMNILSRSPDTSALMTRMSDAFCFGLADLPAGDLRLVISGGKYAPVIDLHSDMWGQARGKGPWKLGATFYCPIAPDYRMAIRAYYRGLIAAGIIKQKRNSPEKNAIIAMPQFNTWGAQLSLLKPGKNFDQRSLENIYAALRKSGMKAKVFVIDDKWQSEYGVLEHSAERFPHFEAFLDRLRNDGFKVGLWAAFLRCENPASLGLDTSNMLHDTNGKPVRFSAKPFYYLDVSQPKVQEALRNDVRRFMKRYHPDIVKFDFGYELPSLSMGAPADPSWLGERYLKKCLDIILPALREVNPNVAVMYYSLSPLFIDEIDIHSTDDLFLNEEEFALQANYRLFFSSLLGEIGIPSYGSGGYTWLNMDEIWFDSAPSGSLGSLGSFTGYPDGVPSKRSLSKFNGLAALARKSNVFSVEPLYATRIGANAARASSWIRLENGLPVMAALRTNNIIGGKKIAANYKDQVRSDIMVVVASRDEKSITATNHLGIVPFADGNIDILHEGNVHNANLRAHYFDSTTGPVRKYPLVKGRLMLSLSERSVSGKQVEWYEVNFDH